MDIPSDIDAIASEIVRRDYRGDDDPDFALYLAIANALCVERQSWTEAKPVFIMCEACGSMVDESGECDCTRTGMDCQKLIGLVARPVPSPHPVKEEE